MNLAISRVRLRPWGVWLGFAGALVLCVRSQGQQDGGWELVAAGAWDSAYVSEGRDNIPGGGLISASIDAAWKGWSFSGWAAHGVSVNYTEYNAGLGYSFDLGPAGVSIGYTRLEFGGVGEGPGDNEFALAIVIPVPGAIELAVGGRYSTEAEGSFGEIFVRRPIPVGKSGLVIAPYVMFGFDYGYATAEHDGSNHTEGGMALECPLGDATLSVYCAHCWAGRDVELDNGEDLTWGGVRLAFGF